MKQLLERPDIGETQDFCLGRDAWTPTPSDGYTVSLKQSDRVRSVVNAKTYPISAKLAAVRSIMETPTPSEVVEEVFRWAGRAAEKARTA